MSTRAHWAVIGCVLLTACQAKAPAEKEPSPVAAAEPGPMSEPEPAEATPAPAPAEEAPAPAAKAPAPVPPPVSFEGHPLPTLPVVYQTDFQDGKLDRWEATDARAWRVEDAGSRDVAEKTHARHCLLRYARRLAEEGHAPRAVDVCRHLLAHAPADEASVASAAFYQLIGMLDRADVPAEVAAGVGSDNPAIRTAAIRAAKAMEGTEATRQLAAALTRIPPEGRAALLRHLRERGDAAALPGAVKALGDEREDVRVAAIEAVGALGKKDSAPKLIPFLGKDGDEAEAAGRALAGMGDEGLNDALMKALANAASGERIGILAVLASRDAPAHEYVFLRHARDEDKRVRHAALKILGTQGNEGVVSGLRDVLAATTDAGEQEVVTRALLGSVRKLPDDAHAKIAVNLVAGYDGAAPHVKRATLQVLACTAKGYPAGLTTVRAALTDADPGVRTAAVRALADWPGTTSMDDLLEIATTTTDEAHHVLALRGYLKAVPVLGASEKREDRDEAVRRCKQALAAARRLEEKKQALGTAGGMKHPDALSLAVSFLGDADLNPEAAAAAIKIAAAIMDRHALTAIDAIERVLDTTRVEALRHGALRALASRPNAAAAKALLDFARRADDKTERVLALKEYVRLVPPLTKGDEDAAKRAYEDALAAARGADEKRLVEAAKDGGGADVKLGRPKACAVVSEGLKPGALVYGDREYTYVSVPDDLMDATYLTTANDDKGNSAKEYLVFTVSAPATVYVGFDNRATQLPGWLRDWRDTKQSLRTTDSGCRLKLYAKSFPAGTVALGGNKAPGAGSHYVVVIGR